MKTDFLKQKIDQHFIPANDINDGVFMTNANILWYFKTNETGENYKEISKCSLVLIARTMLDRGFKSVCFRRPFQQVPERGYFLKFKTPTQYKRELYKNSTI